MTERLLRYDSAVAKHVLRTGDILLCRAPRKGSLPARILRWGIQRVTGSVYVHAAMAGMGPAPTRHPLGGVRMLGETVGHRNAHLIDLEEEIRRFPGLYDVYRPTGDDYNPTYAWYFMCRCAGSGYGYSYLWRTWLRRRLGKWVPPIPSSNNFTAQRDCSGLVHAALRFGNGPQVAEFDCDVAPGDLSHPLHFKYIATLL